MGNISYSCSVFAVNYRVICFCCVILALSLEGSAVGALGHGGVGLVGYHLDLGKRAVVLLTAMVGALGNGAADRLVGGVAGVGAAGILVIVHFSVSFRDIVFFTVLQPLSYCVRFFKGYSNFYLLLDKTHCLCYS